MNTLWRVYTVPLGSRSITYDYKYETSVVAPTWQRAAVVAIALKKLNGRQLLLEPIRPIVGNSK